MKTILAIIVILMLQAVVIYGGVRIFENITGVDFCEGRPCLLHR